MSEGAGATAVGYHRQAGWEAGRVAGFRGVREEFFSGEATALSKHSQGREGHRHG